MTTYQRSTVYTVDDIRAIADHSGSYFFAPDTMRFFSSRILEGVYPVEGHRATPGNRFLFVTSERHGDAPRHYTIRLATLETVRDNRPSLDIVTVGDYHPTARAARTAAQAHAMSLRTTEG